MARDRLAAMRAQQQSGYGKASPPQHQEGGDDSLSKNDQYEMSEQHAPNDPASGDAMSAFYSEISSLQDSLRILNDNISRISDLHSRSLNNLDDAATQRNTKQLDDLVDETNALTTQLKARITQLRQASGKGREGQIRKQQVGLVKQKFIEAIQNYQLVEQQYRTKYKQRMERQFKIVKPDATPEEVTAVVNNGQGDQIFSQALQSSTRYGESRAAYREVQARHEDIQRIEKTLGELAQLFNDVSLLVDQQDETINSIETTAIVVEGDAEAGLSHTKKAVDSARAARKKRWICFIIVLIILAVIGIVVGVTVSNNK